MAALDERRVPFGEALRTWAYIGFNSFGGPAGQIATLHRVVVGEKRWLSEERFLHALNYCMLLPGPEAQQLAVYCGWLLHRTIGGIVAGVLFVVPGALAMFALALLYVSARHIPWIDAAFFGIRCAVLAIVVEAVIRIGKRALVDNARFLIAASAFTALFVFSVPFPLVVLAALIVGFCLPRSTGERESVSSIGPRPSIARTLLTGLVGLVVWFGPLALIVLFAGGSGLIAHLATFFSQAACVGFGGAYAVLSYVADEAVRVRGWLSTDDMVAGLGLAETTPGPLVLVLQFVGFVAGWKDRDGLTPISGGFLGGFVALWATFVPSTLWILLVAPWIESLRAKPKIASALSAVTAAVVGVILNLALWFAAHVLFTQVEILHEGPLRVLVPLWSTIDPRALAIAGFAAILLFALKRGITTTVAACALAGVAVRLFT